MVCWISDANGFYNRRCKLKLQIELDTSQLTEEFFREARKIQFNPRSTPTEKILARSVVDLGKCVNQLLLAILRSQVGIVLEDGEENPFDFFNNESNG